MTALSALPVPVAYARQQHGEGFALGKGQTYENAARFGRYYAALAATIPTHLQDAYEQWTARTGDPR